MTDREIQRLARRLAERLAARVAREVIFELRSGGIVAVAESPSRDRKEETWRDEERVPECSGPTQSEEDGRSSWSARKAVELITRAQRNAKRAR
jgi:hypothetical protein